MDLANNRIKLILKSKGMTQRKLSKITGIPRGDLSLIIAGKKPGMRFSTVIKIASALGYSVDRIWLDLYD